jgi:membrane-associated phospholipid phosphatase
MPSHHMVFMAAAAFMVYNSNKRLGLILIGLSLISGVARISAGIHYLSDVFAGILLSGFTVFLYMMISRWLTGLNQNSLKFNQDKTSLRRKKEIMR